MALRYRSTKVTIQLQSTAAKRSFAQKFFATFLSIQER